jgi:hypothetical protein
MLRFDLAALGGAVHEVELDGQKIDLSALKTSSRAVVLANHDGKWAVQDSLKAAQKNASRGGPFVTAFNHQMIFVYGTHGSEQAASDAYNSARLVAENFYYRGNGSVDLVPDTAFDPASNPDRNVILFGNADSNSAWTALLGKCPVQVREGSARVGEKEFQGNDLAALLIYPRPGSDTALVATIASSGHAGAVDVERLPVLTSGVGFPDWIVISADSLNKGVPGVRAAGYFGNDWLLESGETAQQ